MLPNIVILPPTDEFTAVTAVNNGEVILAASAPSPEMAREGLLTLIEDVTGAPMEAGAAPDA